MPDTDTDHRPPAINYILSFVLVGLAWGLTTPFIRRAARAHKPDPAHAAILDRPAIKANWLRRTLYGAFFSVVDLLRNPRYAVPLVLNLTGSVWFFLLIGKAGMYHQYLYKYTSLLSAPQILRERKKENSFPSVRFVFFFAKLHPFNPLQASHVLDPSSPPHQPSHPHQNRPTGLASTAKAKQAAFTHSLLLELSLTVPIVNAMAFLFTVLGEWLVEGKVISRETGIGMVLSLAGIALCVQSKN